MASITQRFKRLRFVTGWGTALIVGCGLYFAANVPAHAAVAVIPILDIGTSADYDTPNTGQSYSGTGFVGMYNTSAVGYEAFGHLFGVEQIDFSRTAMQADIGFLSGVTINSAILSFDVLASGGDQNVTVTSFTANGNLGYTWTPPDNLGSVVAPTTSGANSIDLTGLVQSRATAGAPWLGLHLNGTDQYQYTYTYTGYGYGPDSANVRLTVDYEPRSSAVPEPFSAAVWGLVASMCGIGAVIKHKMSAA